MLTLGVMHYYNVTGTDATVFEDSSELSITQ